MVILLILALSSAASLALLVRTISIIGMYKLKPSAQANYEPTVSVCIAARNETHALASCLERVLASDYKKLEVLVLDDSSSDDTSLIIKSFANAGVRFIAGATLPVGWLGKNHAYQTLINESSGDVILFLDVDTTMAPTGVSQLVASISSSNLAMVSVLPRRTDIEHPSAFLNTLRYHWELLLGTKISPPASSAAWMVKKSVLVDERIGLHTYSMSIRPERHMARQLSRRNQYGYFVSTGSLAIGFEKRLKSQWETATRLYYPMTRRNLLRWIAALLTMLLLVAPIVVLLSWQWNSVSLNWALLIYITNSISFAIIFAKIHSPVITRIRILIWPLLLVQEIVLLLRSFLKHNDHSITWKGRQIAAQPIVHDGITINE